mmetsp:Transcript_31307/g.56254  ORF Transcript_31307/g.56254 Transcript_31307/m.56254 type:complete len:106 (-) Transcript_31307:882-1199(-)
MGLGFVSSAWPSSMDGDSQWREVHTSKHYLSTNRWVLGGLEDGQKCILATSQVSRGAFNHRNFTFFAFIIYAFIMFACVVKGEGWVAYVAHGALSKVIKAENCKF